MTSRSDELRRRNRTIFFWSFGVAALLHVALFGLTPPFMVEGWGERDPLLVRGSGEFQDPTVVDAFFGPPALFREDGSLAEEPPSRILAARDLEVGGGAVSRRCLAGFEGRTAPIYTALRLEVGESGRVTEADIHLSTGDECTDALAVAIGRSLRYHWLPSATFPAPVRLIQPLTVGWGPQGESTPESLPEWGDELDADPTSLAPAAPNAATLRTQLAGVTLFARPPPQTLR